MSANRFRLEVVCVNFDFDFGSRETLKRDDDDGMMYNVEIKVVDGINIVHSTRVDNDGKPDDNSILSLAELAPDAIFEIHLKKQRKYLPRLVLGSTSIDTLGLLQKSAEGEFELSLLAPASGWLFHKTKTDSQRVGSIIFSFKVSETLARLRVAVEIAKKKSINGRDDPEDYVHDAMKTLVQVADEIIAVCNAIDDTSLKIWEILEDIAPAVGLLHKLLMKIFSGCALTDMTHCMLGICSAAGGCPQDSHFPRSKELLEQMASCIRFVNEYLNQSIPDVTFQTASRKTIDGYRWLFGSFEMEVSILASLSQESGTVDTTELKTLDHESDPFEDGETATPEQPAQGPTREAGGCREDRHLLPQAPGHLREAQAETRKVLLDSITDFLSANTAPNVFWLCGDSGTGKSTIALTVRNRCKRQGLRVRCVFFERWRNEHVSVILTIAYHLASLLPYLIPRILQAAAAAGDYNRDAIRNGSLKLQFEKLLAGQLRDVRYAGAEPIVLILDALDECWSISRRPRLMRFLIGALAELPPQFRSCITSGSQHDAMAVSSAPDTIRRDTLQCSSQTSQHDIRRYVEENVKDAKEEDVKALCDASGGLFIWASVAVRLLRAHSGQQINIRTLPSDIDGLYAKALSVSGIPWDDKKSRDLFVMVLGLIVTSKEWLTVDVIEEFLDLESGTVEPLLHQLKPFLFCEHGQAVRFYHISFADYLTSCGNEAWYIDRDHHCLAVAKRCLDIMKRMLRFNVCRIPTPFVLNKDIKGSSISISCHLDYACRFWADHLCDVPHGGDSVPCEDDESLLCKLKDFVDCRILYWFEVLSVQGHFDFVALRALLDASFWNKSADVETWSSLWDAYRLALAFRLPIQQSAPQVYLSALSFFTAESRRVSEFYSNHPKISVDRIGSANCSARCIKIIEGHVSAVTSVAASPNKLRVATCSADRTIRIWDAGSGKLFSDPFRGHTDTVLSVAFSPDGERVISGSIDKTIRVWDVDSGELVLGPLEGHTGSVMTVSASHDGQRIVSGSTDKTIRIWDARSGELVLVLEGHLREVTSVAFSPATSEYVVSGSCDRTIRIWRSDTGDCVLDPLRGHEGQIWSVSVSPDELCIASGSEDKTIAIWDAVTGEQLLRMHQAHTDPVTSVSFSPEGKRIASGSSGGVVRISDADTGQLVSGPFVGHVGEVTSVAFLHFSCLVSGSADTSIRFWDASGLGDEVVDARTRMPSEHTTEVNSIAFFPDGRRIVSGSADGAIRIWDIDGRRLVLGPIRNHDWLVTSVDVSPDGKMIVSGSADQTICVRHATTGKLILGSLRGHTNRVTSVSFFPDARHVVSGSADKTICIWDTNSGRVVLGPLQGHTSRVTCVAVSSDGNRIASGAEDETICIWRRDTGQVVTRLLHVDVPWSVIFSPADGRHVVVSGSDDGVIRVWDYIPARGRKIAFLSISIYAHTEPINTISMSPDGRLVASGSNDGTIRVWNVENGDPAGGGGGGLLEGHTGSVTSISYSPDGTRIASGSRDKTIRIWDVASLKNKEQNSDSDWTLSEDGWIRSQRDGEVIMWIPEDVRGILWRPRNTAVFGCQFSTRLGFDIASLREDWARFSQRI